MKAITKSLKYIIDVAIIIEEFMIFSISFETLIFRAFLLNTTVVAVELYNPPRIPVRRYP